MPVFQGDAALLRSFRKGERPALERVYWEYVDTVATVVRRGLCLSHGRRVPGLWSDEASELVQETFVRAFDERARLAYDGLRPYRPYLLAICRNLLVDHARKRGRELPLELDPGDEHPRSDAAPQPGSPNSESWADPVAVQLVRTYLESLSSPLKDVYHQRYVLAASQAKTADALGLTRQRVRTLEAKLRAGLARHMRSKRGRPR